MLTEDQAREMLIRARKRGAIRDYAIIGKDDDATQNPFDSQQSPPTGTGELNTVYARINGNPDPQTVYYSPDTDMRIIAHGARVLIKWIDGQPWIDGADKVYLTQQQNGAPLPTHNFPLRIHDHTSDTEGGSLGADTVDTTQLVDDAVTTAKINALAVTSAELASNAVTTDKITDANVTLAKMASNSVDTSQLVDDAVIPTKTDGLTGSSVAFVTQTASDTFSSIDYTLSANTRLYYDGTDIRSAYTYYDNPTGALATSGTTELVIWTTPDLASVIDVTNSKIIFLAQMTLLEQSDATSRYLFYWKYNYDNGGSEAWEHVDPTNTPVGLARWSAWQVNRDTPLSFTVPFDSSLTGGTGFSAWGYSGTYKLRLSVARQTGTGTLGIFRPIDFTRSFTILEV